MGTPKAKRQGNRGTFFGDQANYMNISRTEIGIEPIKWVPPSAMGTSSHRFTNETFDCPILGDTRRDGAIWCHVLTEIARIATMGGELALVGL